MCCIESSCKMNTKFLIESSSLKAALQTISWIVFPLIMIASVMFAMHMMNAQQYLLTSCVALPVGFQAYCANKTIDEERAKMEGYRRPSTPPTSTVISQMLPSEKGTA